MKLASVAIALAILGSTTWQDADAGSYGLIPSAGVAPAIRIPHAPPKGSSNCEQMQWHLTDVGLPQRFYAIGNRESGQGQCLNTAISRTGCCVGWWQLNEVVFRDHRLIAKMKECDATWKNVRGDSFEAKRAQSCAAKALFDVAGYQPWAT